MVGYQMGTTFLGKDFTYWVELEAAAKANNLDDLVLKNRNLMKLNAELSIKNEQLEYQIKTYKEMVAYLTDKKVREECQEQ